MGGTVELVAVGASAGGVEALRALVHDLPADCPPVLVVLHIGTRTPTVLPGILARAGVLPVELARDGQRLERGRVLVAPPDHHLVVEDARVRLVASARRNGHRPAIDPLFETAATSAGPAVLAMLMSGTLDDGVQGLAAVRAHGGVTAAQDPTEAAFPGMSQAAIDAGVVDHVLTAAKLAALVETLASPGPPSFLRVDPSQAAPGPLRAGDAADHPPGRVSSLTCPSCGGALWEHDRGGVHSYQCRTGHRYAPESLLEAQASTVEDSLWGAYRALLEHADLHQRVARRLRSRGMESAASRREDAHQTALRQAEVLRDVLSGADGEVTGGDEGQPPT